MTDYVLNIEKLIISKLLKNNSVLTKNFIPPFYYDFVSKEPLKGINQLYLAENNNYSGLIGINSLIKNNESCVNKNSIIIGQKENNNINFILYFNKTKDLLKINNVKQKTEYNLFDINELLEYYFTCSINHTKYTPYLEQKEKNNLINFITLNPLKFSENANKIFNLLMENIVYG